MRRAVPPNKLTKSQRWMVAILLLSVLVIASLRFLPGYKEKNDMVEYTPPNTKEIIPQPSRAITLADSTRVFLIGDAKITPSENFPADREVKVDGDMFLEVPEGQDPLVVRTRLLVLTVDKKSAFRVNAYSKDDGEEAQVISGYIRVKKNYKSEFSAPDTLRDNQMVMINITIDLMEKEKFNATDLKAWRDTVRLH